jgi:hypothetical protein
LDAPVGAFAARRKAAITVATEGRSSDDALT